MSQDAGFEVINVIREKTLHKTLELFVYNNDKWAFRLSDSTEDSYQPQYIWCTGFKFDNLNMYAIVVQENKSYDEVVIKEPQNPKFNIRFKRFKQNCYTYLGLLNKRLQDNVLQFETEDQCIFILRWQNELLSHPFSTTKIAVHPRQSLFAPVLFPNSMTPNSRNMNIVLRKNEIGNWVFNVIIPQKPDSSTRIRQNFECIELKFTDNKFFTIHESIPSLIDTDQETRNAMLFNLQKLSKVSLLHPIEKIHDTLTQYTYLTSSESEKETSFLITSSQEHPRLCVVCMDRPRTIKLKPCNHSCLCDTCFHEMGGKNAKCPMCQNVRRGIQELKIPPIEKWYQDVDGRTLELGYVSNPYIIRI